MTHQIFNAFKAGDIAVLGKKGGGKTFTAKGIVESLLDAGSRVLILDPLGVWAGLRTSADGNGPGYPIAIFGGERADLPLNPAAADAMARVIATENLPAVIDLSELSKTAQQGFLLKFLHTLRTVNKEDITLVLEEADVFAPQNPMGDDSKMLHSEIDWIARRGRFRGFRLITITQRPARLSKDVLTQAATLIVHRLPAPQDRDAVKAWVDGNGDRDKAKEVFDTLARLEVGEAWVWATEEDLLERVKFPLIKTLDTSATPKAGEKRVEPKTLADVDVSAISAALAAAVPEPAKGKSPVVKPDPAAIDAARQDGRHAGYTEGHAAGLEEGLRRGRQAVVDRVMAALGEAPVVAPVRAVVAAVPKPVQPPRAAPEGLSPTAQAIMAVIEGVHPRGISYAAAAKRAGASSRSSQYRAYLTQIMASGLVTGDKARLVAVTGSGAPVEPGIEAWRSRLTPSQWAMLEVLEAADRPLRPADVAALSGISPTSSGLGSGLRELVDLELVDKEGGAFSLSPDLRDTGGKGGAG